MSLQACSHRSRVDDTWVIVEVHRTEFAIAANSVREILRMPDITVVPMCRPQTRGVINLRGRVLPLIDMRKHFGWQSVPEELESFYALMNQREKDHRNWLMELEKSIAERTAFHLATDPHKCAFGQWYYSFRSESPWIAALLHKFESPHNRIHAIASATIDLVKAGKDEQALGLVEQKRNGELRAMVTLFQELKGLMRETVRELAMVVTTDQRAFAVSIDRAVAVEAIPPELIKEAGTDVLSPGCEPVHRMVERTAAKSLAVVLEPEMFSI